MSLEIVLRPVAALLAVTGLCGGAAGLVAAQETEIRPLAAGQTVERDLSGGETHRYRLKSETRSYVRLFVRPRGVELNLTVLGPDGKPVAEARDIGEEVGDTTRSLITDANADYEISVSRPPEGSTRGTYILGAAEWRPVSPRDAGRVAAERALEEGDRLNRLRQADAAATTIPRYEEALALSREAEDVSGQSAAHVRIGTVWRRLSDYPRAMESFNRALPLRRESGDKPGEANVLNEIGGTLNDMGEYQKARDAFQQALDLRIGSRLLETSILNNIGASYRRSGDARRARDHYRRALAGAREIGDRRLIATVTNNLGLTSQLVGEYQEALELYDQALRLWRALGEPENEGTTLGNLGLIYRALGNDARALEFYRQSYELRRAAGNRVGEALALTYLGRLYLRMGQREHALARVEEGVALYRAIGDRAGLSQALRDLGEIHEDAAAHPRAMALFRESLELSRAVGNRSSEAAALQSIARSFYLQHDFGKARDGYLEALPLMRESGERRREAATLLGLAQAERALGNAAAALTRIEAAIEIIELLRSRVVSTDLRASFQAANQEYYQLHIDLLMELHRQQPAAGHAGRALQVSERARGRSLLDLLSEAQVDLRQGADPALVEREQELIARINANDARRRQVSAAQAPARLPPLEKELSGLLAAYEEVRAQIRLRSPQYAGLTQPQPLDLAEIQQQVLDRDTLLLEYKLGPERSYLWAVAADAFSSFELPVEGEIDAAARRVYELLLASADRTAAGETRAQKARRLARTRTEYDRAAAALSRMVLGPVAHLLGSKRLVVVSEGALQYVPFAALPRPAADGEAASDPLIDHHEVVSLPSASVLPLLRREQQGRPRGEASVAVLADPVFSADDVRLRAKEAGSAPVRDGADAMASLERSARQTGVSGFRRLRFSRDEATAIAALMPSDGILSALDFRASRATATSPELGRHRIVHFATHGLVNSAHPELSGIVLSLVDEQGRPQDGFLRLHEIYGLELRADLVVLSACQTALGKEVKGEGLVGLTRGFMYAGAPRIVASLWNVEDRATADLMRHFYGAMSGEGMPPAMALRAAQLALRADRRWAAPYYWAAFTLQGDWN